MLDGVPLIKDQARLMKRLILWKTKELQEALRRLDRLTRQKERCTLVSDLYQQEKLQERLDDDVQKSEDSREHENYVESLLQTLEKEQMTVLELDKHVQAKNQEIHSLQNKVVAAWHKEVAGYKQALQERDHSIHSLQESLDKAEERLEVLGSAQNELAKEADQLRQDKIRLNSAVTASQQHNANLE